MKTPKICTLVAFGLMFGLSSVSATAEDVSALLQSEITEIKATFSKIADDAVNDEVKKCILTESNSVIDSQGFQQKLAYCIEKETQPKTVKGLTDTEAQCFSLRYSLLRTITDKCAPKY